MSVTCFEEIIAWQKAKVLTVFLYHVLGQNKDFSFKDQCCRAAISIMNNIAEGFERNADKEFRHFLSIARGSCAEVRSMLYLAQELQYITPADFDKAHTLAREISRLLAAFIRTLRSSTPKT